MISCQKLFPDYAGLLFCSCFFENLLNQSVISDIWHCDGIASFESLVVLGNSFDRMLISGPVSSGNADHGYPTE